MNTRTKINLNFIVDPAKERWFLKNKYPDAKKMIGHKQFRFIVNYNIPDAYDNEEETMNGNILKYIKKNKIDLIKKLNKQKVLLQKRWKKIEKDFFEQMEAITEVKWRKKSYNLYLLYSCLWGGDYDLNKPNVYISPLLEGGDPLYIATHELSHLLYWQYIFSKYGKKLIDKNYEFLWKLSEVMVNYPLLKMNLGIDSPLVIPPNIEKFSKSLLKKFDKEKFVDIITEAVKKKARG